MERFINYSSVVIPIDRSNVDTDAIIPKQFLKSVEKSGFGDNLFDEWRYLDQGEPGQDCSGRPLNSDFVLNKKAYRDGRILLARENFGCGSSREHAPWALLDFGITCVISSSYADIFYNNCFKNGILPITISEEEIKELSNYSVRKEEISIVLEDQKILFGNKEIKFEIDQFKKKCLIEGLDDIALSLEQKTKIEIFEKDLKSSKPWIFND